MGLLARFFGLERRELPVSVGAHNFDAEVRRSELPVLIDVWSPGCAPCKQFEEIVFGMMDRWRGRLKVVEVNAAAEPELSAKLRVRGTPTAIYFHKGREVTRVVGLRGSIYHDAIVRDELLGGSAEAAS